MRKPAGHGTRIAAATTTSSLYRVGFIRLPIRGRGRLRCTSVLIFGQRSSRYSKAPCRLEQSGSRQERRIGHANVKAVGGGLPVGDKEGTAGRTSVGELDDAVGAEPGGNIGGEFYANLLLVVLYARKFDRRRACGDDARRLHLAHPSLKIGDLLLQLLELLGLSIDSSRQSLG